MKAELVVIGGGPAGMAAALAAEEKGIKDILILLLFHIQKCRIIEHFSGNNIDLTTG